MRSPNGCVRLRAGSTIACEDIRVARACVALNPPALGVAAYHCQQAAEKLAKGLLVAAGVPFRKTHDIDELADLMASNYPECRDLLDTIRPLTVWGLPIVILRPRISRSRSRIAPSCITPSASSSNSPGNCIR